MSTPTSGAEITAIQLLTLQRFAESRGLDWEKAVRAFDLKPELAIDPSVMMPFSVCLSLYEYIAREADDDAIGVAFGATVPIGAPGVFDYVVLSAPTLGMGLKNFVRFHPLPTNAFSAQFLDEKNSGILRWEISDHHGPNTQFMGMVVGFGASRIRHIVGDENVPLTADFGHPRPKNLDGYRRYLGKDVRFDQPHYQLTIPKQYLSAVPQHNEANLYRIVEQSALEELRKREEESDALFLATQKIGEALRNGNATLETVAAEMGMSDRSLQRLLEAHGTGFRRLTDKVRKTLAERYLAETSSSLADIAFLLGYSEQSAFSRAAKAWFGMSPNEYRKQKKAAQQ